MRDQEMVYVHLVRPQLDGAVCGERDFDEPRAKTFFRRAYTCPVSQSGWFSRHLAIEALESPWVDGTGFAHFFDAAGSTVQLNRREVLIGYGAALLVLAPSCAG
jgi:hypothetical protein